VHDTVAVFREEKVRTVFARASSMLSRPTIASPARLTKRGTAFMSQMPTKSVLVSMSVTNRSRSASVRLRSVMSRTIFDAPTTLPVSSLIGETVRETRIR
jgi:hypothetical protein